MVDMVDMMGSHGLRISNVYPNISRLYQTIIIKCFDVNMNKKYVNTHYHRGIHHCINNKAPVKHRLDIFFVRTFLGSH